MESFLARFRISSAWSRNNPFWTNLRLNDCAIVISSSTNPQLDIFRSASGWGRMSSNHRHGVWTSATPTAKLLHVLFRSCSNELMFCSRETNMYGNIRDIPEHALAAISTAKKPILIFFFGNARWQYVREVASA